MHMTILGSQWYVLMKGIYYSIFITMTYEELLEEIYHKAAQKGFFNELHDLVTELKMESPKTSNVDLVQIAYQKLKLAQPHPNPSSVYTP